jgi:hypothetical protein
MPALRECQTPMKMCFWIQYICQERSTTLIKIRKEYLKKKKKKQGGARQWSKFSWGLGKNV